MKLGRPSVFSTEVADAICERIADGESLRTICLDDDMPAKSTVFGWLADPSHELFRTKYAYAREAQTDAMVDEMPDIADNGSNDWMEKRNGDGENIGWQENGEALRRSALRISTRQWIAEKLKPKKYGAKITSEVTGKDGKDLVPEASPRELAKAVALMLARGMKGGAE